MRRIEPVISAHAWHHAFSTRSFKAKRRCCMHGGVEGSGAPKGNQNALKHGYYTQRAIKEQRMVRELIGQARSLLTEMESK